MPISTISNSYSNKPSIFLYILGIVGIGAVVYFGGEVIKNVGNLAGKAGLYVEVKNSEADVYLNDKFMGKTPYESKDIKPGENKLTLKTPTRQYQTTLNFLPNTKDFVHLVGVIRDLGISDEFSAGQEFWFEKEESNSMIRIISNPAGADVYVDNELVGKTPYSGSNISEGSYELKIVKEGYEAQSTRINTKKGYALNASIKLFPIPVPTKITAFTDSTKLYDVSSDKPVLTQNTQDWSLALIYWNKTRGININGLGENKEPFFQYLVDYKGNIYNTEGTLLRTKEDIGILKTLENKNGAYLGNRLEQEGLSKNAKEALSNILGTNLLVKTGKVLATPTGWLRVRSEPSLGGTEVTRIDSGGEYPILESKNGWAKIKVSETTQGWVSEDYIKLVN